MTKTNEILKILRFFRNIEFFAPFDLDRVKQACRDSVIELELNSPVLTPWGNLESYGLDPSYEYNYDLYLAPFERQEIKKLLLTKLPELEQEGYSGVRIDEGLSCFARLRIGDRGELIKTDTSISTLPWACETFINQEELSLKAFDHFCTSYLKWLDDYLVTLKKQDLPLVLSYQSLIGLCEGLTRNRDLKFCPNSLLGYLLPYKMRKRKEQEDNGEEAQSDQDVIYRKVEILNSFYLRDLEKISQFPSSISAPLNAYFNATLSTSNDRIDLLSEKSAISSYLKKEKTLLARWPSNVELSLSETQEFAVCHFLNSSQALCAVNGPPGTGKSFIIRDLIANLVVLRASELAKYKRPENVFKADFTEVVIGGKTVRYRALDDQLTGFELMIASSNNSAVNNISKELPLKKALGEEFQDSQYLSSIARMYFFEDDNQEERELDDSAYYYQDVWGFPSVALGKKANRSKFVNKSFYPPREEKEKQKQKRVEEQILSFIERRKSAPESFKSYRVAREDFLAALSKIENTTKLENLNNAELNREKSKLFLLALAFTESWLRETPRLEVDFAALAQFLRNPSAIPTEDALNLWRLFFMFIPVASSTLASVERQFSVAPKETFGYLVVDEAGQATPRSAVGVLQRAKKALILGDQRQLEPICELSDFLVKSLAENLNQDLLTKLSPLSSSVQSIADSQNKYGVYLTQSSNKAWIATPLLVHRRCLEPMFSLSNSIAYDGLMQFATVDEQYHTILQESGWYQVEGRCSSKQWVVEQGRVAKTLLSHLLLRDTTEPDLFFISPFREVVQNLKLILPPLLKNSGVPDEYRKNFSKRIGTVHSFQGKEADIVFFVLGGDHSTIGACEWAGAKPNLINVAITRAKKRLYVIGDRNVWHNKGYFSDLQKGLVVKNFRI